MTAERIRRAAVAALLAAAPTLAAAEADGPLGECLACHGETAEPGVPKLGGQPELFTLYQLVFFRDGQRPNEIMATMLEDRPDAELRELAAAVAALPPPEPAPGEPDAAMAARGAELSDGHRCGACHLPDYSGARHVPRLAGQDETYLLETMRAFRSGERIGIRAAMAEVLAGLTDADLAALAHYLAHEPG